MAGFFFVKLVEEENMSREGNVRKKRCLPWCVPPFLVFVDISLSSYY